MKSDERKRFALQFVAVVAILVTARFLLGYFGVLQILVPFSAGYIFAALTFWPLLYLYLKYKILTTPGTDRGQGIVNPGEDLEKLFKKPAKTLEQLIDEDVSKESLTWGELDIQFQGKRSDRELYFAALKDETLFIQSVAHKSAGQRLKWGSKGDEVDRQLYPQYSRKYAALAWAFESSLLRPNAHQLVAPEERTHQRWYFALRLVCQSNEQLYSDKFNIREKVPGVAHFESVFQQHFRSHQTITENPYFLNMFLSRLWINLRESPEVVGKIFEIIQTKLQIALNDYNNYFSDVVIRKLDLGSKPPILSNIRLLPPDQELADPIHDLKLDLDIEYRDGDAVLSLAAKVSVGPATVEIGATVFIQGLIGKIVLVIPPFPHGRIALSFADDPEITIDVEVTFGSKFAPSLSALPGSLKKFIYARIRDVFHEGFVLPNREYIMLPGVPDNEPAKPLTQVEVRNQGVTVIGNSLNSSDIMSSDESSGDSLKTFSDLKKEHSRPSPELKKEPIKDKDKDKEKDKAKDKKDRQKSAQELEEEKKSTGFFGRLRRRDGTHTLDREAEVELERAVVELAMSTTIDASSSENSKQSSFFDTPKERSEKEKSTESSVSFSRTLPGEIEKEGGNSLLNYRALVRTATPDRRALLQAIQSRAPSILSSSTSPSASTTASTSTTSGSIPSASMSIPNSATSTTYNLSGSSSVSAPLSPLSPRLQSQSSTSPPSERDNFPAEEEEGGIESSGASTTSNHSSFKSRVMAKIRRISKATSTSKVNTTSPPVGKSKRNSQLGAALSEETSNEDSLVDLQDTDVEIQRNYSDTSSTTSSVDCSDSTMSSVASIPDKCHRRSRSFDLFIDSNSVRDTPNVSLASSLSKSGKKEDKSKKQSKPKTHRRRRTLERPEVRAIAAGVSSSVKR